MSKKQIKKDLEIVKEAIKIFKDSKRLGAVKTLIINIQGDIKL